MRAAVGEAPAVSAPWQARLDLDYAPTDGRTNLAAARHSGPLRVQRPFFPEGAVNHTYVLHPPGGVVGGDEIEIVVGVAQQAHALVTAPGAAKFYRSAGPAARWRQRLEVEGVLEWLPPASIYFDGCHAQAETELRLGPEARVVLWEIGCLGRPAGEQPFVSGSVAATLRVVAGETPLLEDTLRLTGGDRLATAAWGLGGRTAVGTMLCYPADEALLGLAREALGDSAACAATRIDELLVVRALADGAEALKQRFIAVWTAVRPSLLGRPACAPRIWNT